MAEGQDFDSCAVCGRTILHGERVTEYVTPEGAPAGVCALCKTAAEDAGWVAAALAARTGSVDAGRRRSLGLRQRLTRVSEAARGLRARPPGADASPPADDGPRAKEERAGTVREPDPRRRRPARARRPQRAQRPTEAQPGGRNAGKKGLAEGRGERRPSSRERLLASAVEVFNRSRERRKVAGLIRSLGEPRVAVRPSSGIAVLTIAWELSWYQWEVRTEDGGAAIRESGKGTEVAQLSERDRDWNASIDSDGTVRLEAAATRETPGEPG